MEWHQKVIDRFNLKRIAFFLILIFFFFNLTLNNKAVGTSRWREEELSVPLEDLSAWLNTLYLLQTQHDGELQGSNSLEDVELHQLQFPFSPWLTRHQLKSRGRILLLDLQSANPEGFHPGEGFLQISHGHMRAEPHSPAQRSSGVCRAGCWWSRSSWCVINRKAVCGANLCAADVFRSLSSSWGAVVLLPSPRGWLCSYHRGFFLQKCSEITVTGKCVATPQPEVRVALLLLGLENNQQLAVFLKHEGRRWGTKPFCTPGPPVGPPDCSLLPLHFPASSFLGNLRHKKLVLLLAWGRAASLGPIQTPLFPCWM